MISAFRFTDNVQRNMLSVPSGFARVFITRIYMQNVYRMYTRVSIHTIQYVYRIDTKIYKVYTEYIQK